MAYLSCVMCFQVFSFIHAQVTFFHQGSDLLRDLEPTMKTMAAQVLTLKPFYLYSLLLE